MQKTLKIDQIKPNPDNPRIIKDDKFKKLVKSLQEFPEMTQIRRVVVNKDLMILGGNMRWRAAKEAGWTDIPVDIVDLPEDKQREFIIKDNVSGGEWDWDTLANEWSKEQLEDWGVDIENWTNDEVVEDDVPDLDDTIKPESKLGEVYQLGRHRVMCGDATKIEDVEKLMEGKKAELFMGDPPYGMRLDTNYSSMHGMHRGKKHEEVIGDHDDFDASLLLPIVGDIKEQIWFGADYYAKSLGDTEHAGCWCVWDKRVEESQDAGFGSCFELFWSKQKHKRMIYRYQWAGFFTQGEKRDFEHPTEKSVRLISRLVQDFTEPDDIVLDLFGGSGSTLIACEQTDRTCYMMELDPKYCDVIRKRYHKFITGSEEGWIEATPVIK